uniref:Uncharacterized protein n=1 Tax=Lotharella oceanica TaxID=641309 RepID=A0A7S2XBU3_9EUKA
MDEQKTPLQGEENKSNIEINIDFAPVDDLKATTVCCCCMQSFYVEWPAACGVQGSISCICIEYQMSMKCLQFLQENRTCMQSYQYLHCIDMTKDFICLDTANQFIMCFCIKGASKLWCGFDELKPCAGKGNCLCCDLRCALPPSQETVAFGFACCGKPLYPADYVGGSMH